ncbi:MAG: imidazole glycerol phosphate synthase subunit HisH [Opitutales bacterium]
MSQDATDFQHLDICVIDPGMGNLRSVCRSWERAGARVRLAERAEAIGEPHALVFPGQGGMKNLMAELRERGFDAALHDWITADRPYFGICLGLQALFEYAEESNGPGLAILSGKVPRFQLAPEFKIPHMGWNAVELRQPNALRGGPASGDQFYFVHSYFAQPADPNLVWMETSYGGTRYCSAIRRGNCFATQFHPEKSQAKGQDLLRAFLAYVTSR